MIVTGVPSHVDILYTPSRQVPIHYDLSHVNILKCPSTMILNGILSHVDILLPLQHASAHPL